MTLETYFSAAKETKSLPPPVLQPVVTMVTRHSDSLHLNMILQRMKQQQYFFKLSDVIKELQLNCNSSSSTKVASKREP